MELASRISKIKPSPTLAITVKAQTLRAQGRDIIDFGAGEPDFDTPPNIKAAAIKAIEAGFTKYTSVGGIDELKDAIIDKFIHNNRLSYDRSQIAVSCGGKHVLYNLAQVLFEEGDEVIIPSPYWVSYIDIVVLSGARPVIIETEEKSEFKIRPNDLEKAINQNTKAIIINSPSNPTGTVYNLTELEDLAEIIIKKNILVISDDIYEGIMYDNGSFCNIANISEKIKAMTIVVNGVSKPYAMTGWRIGYAAGPAEIISAVIKIQSQSTSNPTSISQKAAIEALKGDQKVVDKMVSEFATRRNYVVQKLNVISDITCINPQGAFYVFPNVSSFFGRSYGGRTIANSSDMANYLLDEVDVAVLPGVVFGSDNHIRISYATSMNNIEKGLQRIEDALMKLK